MSNGQWTHAGETGFKNHDQRERSAEVGILIGRKDFWNQGYGGETMQLIVGHGFQNLNLNRIFLQVFEANLAGIRCYEKAGFKHEDRLRCTLRYCGWKPHCFGYLRSTLLRVARRRVFTRAIT